MEQSSTTTTTGDLKRYLEFEVGGSMHAFELSDVREVVALTKYSASPQSVGCFIGYTAVRDEVVPLFDLRIFLGAPTNVTYDTSIIICHYLNKTVGIIVDVIHTVISSNKSEDTDLPGENRTVPRKDCVSKVIKMDTYLTLVLDVEAFIKSSKIAKDIHEGDESNKSEAVA